MGLLGRLLCLESPTWAAYPLWWFRTGNRCRVPLSPYLDAFGWDAVPHPPLRLSLWRGKGYPFSPLLGRPHARFGNWVYGDAEYGFVLEQEVRNGRRTGLTPRAVVTFDIERTEEGALPVVRQLQALFRGMDPRAITAPENPLAGLRWERMFLRVVADWAAAQGFPAVACIRGTDSRWATYPEIKKRFHVRYDVSAQRNGFRFNEQRRLWVRQLPAV